MRAAIHKELLEAEGGLVAGGTALSDKYCSVWQIGTTAAAVVSRLVDKRCKFRFEPR
jgi:hypothetical protein